MLFIQKLNIFTTYTQKQMNQQRSFRHTKLPSEFIRDSAELKQWKCIPLKSLCASVLLSPGRVQQNANSSSDSSSCYRCSSLLTDRFSLGTQQLSVMKEITASSTNGSLISCLVCPVRLLTLPLHPPFRTIFVTFQSLTRKCGERCRGSFHH